ncbi:cobyrinate a,c-diamide synthase [Spirosoma sp. KUDC1026]|uniref:cobyrinate a,c-diamide synthase n=1 Tax=Spirosoma sp. KUDC1026 TaxID=2745947 RepID=UPI00159B9275|nr:cobyrinate a,c-diamide synthase [Spirosoma sp. KUDC1026]QKZ15394.1 cobyrinate a,c-diamide synthase [Spirosoma sp. KUDC1026]
MSNQSIFSQFLLAAPASGSGKTTLTLGLLRALANRGLRVQPFKCGPDYIDTRHHQTAASGEAHSGVPPSINLDLFMSSPEHVVDSYQRYASGADVAITEGVMGLFDGADRMQGSSASIAELLDIPVVLVVNAKAMAYSVAPLLYGFKHFYTGINLVGAIFNNVGSASHYRFLADACADVGVEPLGYLPSNPRFTIPSRHLGLHISAETDYEQIIQAIAEELPKTINLDRLLAVTQRPNPSPQSYTPPPQPSAQSNLRISVARDEAFTFTYEQNLDVLARWGRVTFFSPLHDKELPETDFLYLPGGYPELYAQQLSENIAMRTSIGDYCQAGGLTYAECGGLMYLSQSIQTESVQRNNSTAWPMVGVLNITTSMLSPKLTLGYRIVDWDGMTLKGHEFHYSTQQEPMLQTSIASVTNAKGVPVNTKLYRTHNTVASYVHLYWGDKPEFIQHLLSSSFRTDNHIKPELAIQ